MSATGSVGYSFGAGEEDEVEAADEVEACGVRIAVGLALARDNLPPAERAARHRVVVVGKGARGERVSWQ